MEPADSPETCERIEAYIRPYVLALLRITVAAYERERRDEAIARAMQWERPTSATSDTQRAALRSRPRHQEEHPDRRV